MDGQLKVTNMKHDEGKPQSINFYWDGLRNSNQRYQSVIACFQKFIETPTLDTLVNFQAMFIEASKFSDKNVDELMHVYDYGAQLYGDKNYKGLEIDRFINAMGRHLSKELLTYNGIDDDSGYPHKVHVMANILIAAELIN